MRTNAFICDRCGATKPKDDMYRVGWRLNEFGSSWHVYYVCRACKQEYFSGMRFGIGCPWLP